MEELEELLIGELVQPKTLSSVTQEDVIHFQQNGQLQIPSGPANDCIRSIERYKSVLSRSEKEVAIYLMRLYGHFADFAKDGNWIKFPIDLFVIENDGSMASFLVKHKLDKHIDAQANVRIDRHFQSESDSQYRYAVRRPSVGPRFGENEKHAVVINPTCATGKSVLAGFDWLRDEIGIDIPLNRVSVWTMVAAPLAVQNLCSQGASVVTARLADGIDENGYIIQRSFDEKDPTKTEQYIGNVSDFLARI